MAYFAFMQRENQEFIFEVTNEERIAEARRIISGEEKESVHVMGKIVMRKQPYNPDWDFHFDPASITFFTMMVEVCDANMQYVEDHLDEAGGPFLPGRFWCPWDSTVIREIEA